MKKSSLGSRYIINAGYLYEGEQTTFPDWASDEENWESDTEQETDWVYIWNACNSPVFLVLYDKFYFEEDENTLEVSPANAFQRYGYFETSIYVRQLDFDTGWFEDKGIELGKKLANYVDNFFIWADADSGFSIQKLEDIEKYQLALVPKAVSPVAKLDCAVPQTILPLQD